MLTSFGNFDDVPWPQHTNKLSRNQQTYKTCLVFDCYDIKVNDRNKFYSPKNGNSLCPWEK